MPVVIALKSRWVPGARVRVVVYDDFDSMRAAARRWNGVVLEDGVLGCTQSTTRIHVDEDGEQDGEQCRPIVRLVRGHLSMEVVAHELHHAVTGIWGAHCRSEGLDPDLSCANEPFAYLYGALLTRLVDCLYARGCYDGKGSDA